MSIPQRMAVGRIRWQNILKVAALAVVISGVLGTAPQAAQAAFIQCTNDNFVAAIRDKAANNTWIGNMLDGPWQVGGGTTTGNRAVPLGCFSRYDKAWIYVSSQTPASLVYGYIFGKWGKLGWERGALGYPVADEDDVSDLTGRVSYFQFGAIYWKKGAQDAFAAYGLIGDRYIKWGGPTTLIGYPIADERDWFPDNNVGRARISFFEHGAIQWDEKNGVHGFWGYVYDCWRQKMNAHAKAGVHAVSVDISGDGSHGTVTFDDGWVRLSAQQGQYSYCTVSQRID